LWFIKAHESIQRNGSILKIDTFGKPEKMSAYHKSLVNENTSTNYYNFFLSFILALTILTTIVKGPYALKKPKTINLKQIQMVLFGRMNENKIRL